MNTKAKETNGDFKLTPYKYDQNTDTNLEWKALTNLYEKLMVRSERGDAYAFQLAKDLIPELEVAKKKRSSLTSRL